MHTITAPYAPEKKVRFTLIFLFFLGACTGTSTLFREVPASESGLLFNNQIIEDDTLNVLHYEYLYNGGGVGIGDFNGDSLPDIYFTGSRVPNKLFLNEGRLKFKDITAQAGVAGEGKWCKGVSVADVNNDGRLDIYVSAAVLPPAERKNILYINQGVDKKSGVPVFKDEAAAYGLDDTASTQMAAFFDYDNDGDLDVYLVENELDGTYPNEFRPIHKDGSWPNTDKLLRNDWDSSLQHPVFTDVSKQAGILIEGYGLGVNIADVNNDGWKDIYVSNDYLSNNHFYINNRNGTFTDHCTDYLKHTSKNAMGNDIADINNDGLPDILELDMAPADNYRQKMMHNEISYQTFQASAQFGYMHQYMRNTLQLNQGPAPGDSTGRPVFSEVAYYAGFAQTDWSWAPLAVDVNNDGYRDVLISNGLPKDMSDLDFMAYRKEAMAVTPLATMLQQVPSVKVPNYAFQNNGDVTFTDKTADWGWRKPTFSSGMAYADLDNDGDVDIVINNTNMDASLLENTANDQNGGASNFLRVRLKGGHNNRNGIGSIIRIYYQGQQQVYDATPYRGYMSSVEAVAHFGLGSATTVDSVTIVWPGSKKQTLRNVRANQTLTVKESDAAAPQSTWGFEKVAAPWFTDVTASSGLHLLSSEVDFIDFNIQRMLPHKLSQYGPALAAGDVNGDGLDDLIVGSGSPNYAHLFLQTANGRFAEKKFLDTTALKYQDDAGLCLFDADGDDDLDLYIASGGFENEPFSKAYIDHFYVNDGRGNFTENTTAFEPARITKSCVKAADFDGDGDLDLFVGGRVLPGSYPQPVRSFMYRNDSKDGVLKFVDVTKTVAPALQNIGLVSDAVWSDADNDGWPDLLLAGEWMPLTILKNGAGKFVVIKTALDSAAGWWNSITPADVDNDGDLDYIAGNFGANGFIKPAPQRPVKGYAKDFDNNGSFDAVFTTWIPTKNGEWMECPIAGRDDFLKEMTVMKERFPNYASYANAGINALFTKDEVADALQVSATEFRSCWIENRGHMQFLLHSLPAPAQWAPLYGLAVGDFNGDGNIDLALNGNEYSMAPALGRYDALNGLVLQGDGRGNFKPVSLMRSGFYVPGNGKALIQIVVGNKPMLAAAQNASYLKLFQNPMSFQVPIPLQADEQYALVHLTNGKVRKEEFVYGSSFFSQSGRFVMLNPSINFVDIINNKNQKRVITNQKK